MNTIALKVDVDTDHGTRQGVPNLVHMFLRHKVSATFFFSLGPDNTGKAIRRIFRPGFLQKIWRTRVPTTYHWRTLLSGTLLPAPIIGEKNADLLRWTRDNGFETAIHCYDHCKWQDELSTMTHKEAQEEFGKALSLFQEIFRKKPRGAAAPGWQATPHSLQVYENAGLLYGSDCRGSQPCFPLVNQKPTGVIQIPTNLPTLDEIIGTMPNCNLLEHLMSHLKSDVINVFTLHAEVEGISHINFLERFIEACIGREMHFITLEQAAHTLLQQREKIPVKTLKNGSIPGRSGTVALI